MKKEIILKEWETTILLGVMMILVWVVWKLGYWWGKRNQKQK
jgi:hypothetical protein